MSKDVEPRELVPRLRFPQFVEAGPFTLTPLSTLASPVTERAGDADVVPYTITGGVGLVSQEEKLGRTIAGKSISNYYRLRRGDFAFNKSSTKAHPEGYIARLHDDVEAAVPSSIFTCFRCVSEEVDGEYLDWLFQSNLHGHWLRKFITVGARAHGALNVNDDDLYALPVPLPSGKTSRAEQRKIAECLGSLDDWIAAETDAMAALRRHKTGLMQQLFPRPERIENGQKVPAETRPRLRFPEFETNKGWAEVSLGDFIDIASGQVDPTVMPYCDMPHISGEHIISHGYGLTKLQTAKELRQTSGKYLFGPDDVLYSKIRPALNKAALPTIHGTCSADIYPVRPSSDKLIRTYLFYLLLSPSFLQHAILNSERGKIPKVNRAALLSYSTRLPEPDEQCRIAGCLVSLDARISAQSDKLSALRRHKRGLMQKLFPQVDDHAGGAP